MHSRLRYESCALRALKKLDARDRATIVAALEAFADGRSPTADVRKLDVKPPTWRLRVGRFRVLYRLAGGDVVAMAVEDRKDVYR